MKKYSSILFSFIAAILCFNLSIPAYATELTNVALEDLELHDDSSEEESDNLIHKTEGSTNEIIVEGLEGETIKEVTDIELPRTRSSCGIFHSWSVTSAIQEGNCDTEGIYRVKCTVCGATGTVFTDAPGHYYINGECVKCGDRQDVDDIEVAPAGELEKWDYTLDGINKLIKLTKYIGTDTDLVIYGKYQVNGITYNTVLNGAHNSGPFAYKGHILLSLIIKDGVISTDCDFLFYGCRYLTKLDVSGLDTSDVTNMSGMFRECFSLTDIDISSLNTSNVTNMDGMFQFCLSIEKLDLSNFNTSKVTNMFFMFADCSNLSSINVNNFDTSDTIYMDYMFFSCNFSSLDLTNFDMQKIEGTRGMFEDCTNLTTIYVDRKKWNTTFADTTDMFKNCGTSRVTPL